jgi:hypothetical protein
MHVLNISVGYSCPILIKTETYQQILVKLANIKFRENPISGSEVSLIQIDGRMKCA